jgi:hypothetical protein
MRTRSITESAGTAGMNYADTAGIGDHPGTSPFNYHTCIDEVGSRLESHDLDIVHRTSALWWVSGVINGFWHMDNFCVAPLADGSFWPGYLSGSLAPNVPVPSLNSALSQGLAITNPNKPSVDIPVFIKELGDIPRMLRDWGKVLLKKPTFAGKVNLNEVPRSVASRYLEWEFAIKPFLSDVAKMLDFQGQVEKKLATLRNLKDPLASSFTGTVYTDSKDSPQWTDYATSVYQESRQVQHRDVADRRMWVSTRWKPTVPIPVTDAELYWLAVRLAYGLDISLATLWEAMPWSWLIDWFSNVGDLAAAHRNTVPVDNSDSCVMLHTKVTRRIENLIVTPPSTLILRVNPYTYERKQRWALGSVDPVLEFNLPFLDSRQAAILGSLAVLKLKR